MADIEKINQERHEILEKLQADLNEIFVPAMIRVPEEVDKHTEILTVDFEELGVSHDEVLGEFYFQPLNSDEDVVGFFTCVMTLSEEVYEETLARLYEAISVLNFYIPNGAFGVSKDMGAITYRVCLVYPLTTEKDALFDLANAAMGNTLTLLDRWVDIVLRISEGKGDVRDIESALGL